MFWSRKLSQLVLEPGGQLPQDRLLWLLPIVVTVPSEVIDLGDI